jgi:hypothetical protein
MNKRPELITEARLLGVRIWALADWQLSRPISAGRLLGTMDAREGPERQKAVASGQAAFSGEAW